ncbi:MAG: hypothetical protein RBS39_02675 [Phycisphaerales bacterium]|jgi:hypothetical protein|nr:hypothetical protein [Phycisphaerales bacterium]
MFIRSRTPEVRRAIGLLALAAAAVPASATVVYQNNFELESGLSEWSHTLVDTTPIGARNFLGQFVNDTVTLSLDSLPAEHTELRITFDLYIIGTWDGNELPGPDVWQLRVDGNTVVDTTFAVGDETSWRRQSYPVIDGSGGLFQNRQGSMEDDTLGYTWNGFNRDSVFHLDIIIPHSGDTATLDFLAMGLQTALGDESWGIDNVLVQAPAPGALAALSMGGVMVGRRRRR